MSSISSHNRWRTETLPLYVVLNLPRIALACSMRLASSRSSLLAARMWPVQVDQLDAEFVGQQHRRVEELRARLLGDTAREKAVALHLGRLGARLRGRGSD